MKRRSIKELRLLWAWQRDHFIRVYERSDKKWERQMALQLAMFHEFLVLSGAR